MGDIATRPNPGGRKPDPSKDRAIVEAARASFFERGFASSTIEDIAQRAEVSKVTVYKRFTDKETLFEAVVRAEVDVMQATFEAAEPEWGSIETRLNTFGRTLLTFLFRPDHVALERALGQELLSMPLLARRFYDAGPGYCRAWLANVLRAAAETGEIAVDDPQLAAADLFALWRGFTDIELRLGIVDAVDADGIARQVRRGTEQFLRTARR